MSVVTSFYHVAVFEKFVSADGALLLPQDQMPVLCILNALALAQHQALNYRNLTLLHQVCRLMGSKNMVVRL